MALRRVPAFAPIWFITVALASAQAGEGITVDISADFTSLGVGQRAQLADGKAAFRFKQKECDCDKKCPKDPMCACCLALVKLKDLKTNTPDSAAGTITLRGGEYKVDLETGSGTIIEFKSARKADGKVLVTEAGQTLELVPKGKMK